MIVGALSFPISLFCASNQQGLVQNVLTCFSQIQKIIQSTPQIILGDYKDVISLIGHIGELSKIGNDFIKCAKSNAQSPMFPLYKQSADALSKIVVDLPTYTLPLPHIADFDSPDIFVCSLIACVTRSLCLSIENKPLIDKADATTYQLFSAPFTYIFSADAFLHAQPQASVTLTPLMSNLRTSLDVVNSIVIQIASGKKPPEASHLPAYTQAIIKATEELLSSILLLKQPSLPYDIPDDVQEIRRFDSMASGLHSTALKTFAQFIVDNF